MLLVCAVQRWEKLQNVSQHENASGYDIADMNFCQANFVGVVAD